MRKLGLSLFTAALILGGTSRGEAQQQLPKPNAVKTIPGFPCWPDCSWDFGVCDCTILAPIVVT
jgi:hypothetical protein